MGAANDLKTGWYERDSERRLADMSALLAEPGGRRMIMHLVTLSGVYRKSQATSEAGLAYEAARRDMGLDIIAMCNAAAPQMVLLAMQERTAELSERAEQMREAVEAEKRNTKGIL